MGVVLKGAEGEPTHPPNEVLDPTQTLVLTVEEAALLLRVSAKTLNRLIHNDEIQIVRIRRCIRVPMRSIVDYVDRNSRYNSGCAGSVVQGASTCHISAKTVRTGGQLSQTQTVKELDALLEIPTARRRKL